MFENMSHEAFWRAYRRAYWRKLSSVLTGKSNNLLPYQLVRDELPFSGQRDIGLQTIPIDKIIGSVGRYRDFDRAFLPLRRENNERWVNISLARYKDIELPPIDVYQIGEVYFVRDGNHRISVARHRGQSMIDAYVTEIEVPIPLTADLEIEDIRQKRTYAEFIQQTGLNRLRPNVDLELSLPGEYGRLLNHIATHQYYMGLEQNRTVPYQEAVLSWYDTVYMPLIDFIKEHHLPERYPDRTLTDLYWWVSEYKWLRQESSIDDDKVEKAIQEFLNIYGESEVRNVIRKLRQETWIDTLILQQEEEHFFATTNLHQIRPLANIHLTLPGKYQKLLDHISEHRWFLGERHGSEVAYAEAVASWYDTVYKPVVAIIKEQGYIDRFPGRTDADLYLWTLDHRDELKEALASLPQLASEEE